MDSPESSASLEIAPLTGPRLAPLPRPQFCAPGKISKYNVDERDAEYFRRIEEGGESLQQFFDRKKAEYVRQINDEGLMSALRQRYIEKMNEKMNERMNKRRSIEPKPEFEFDSVRDRKKVDKYFKSLNESGGYDVDKAYFQVHNRKDKMILPIVPAFCDKDDQQLIDCSVRALHLYNSKEGTSYMLHKVLKANYGVKLGTVYYITFLAKPKPKPKAKAKDPYKTLKPFQAEVFVPPNPDHPIQVRLVRPKP